MNSGVDKDNWIEAPHHLNIAILLPCYNEAASIANVIIDFRRALPGHRIFVYDNNSTDDTAQQASMAGAIVVPSRRQGKGNVVRQMFSEIEADIYIMADGDGTYDASAAPKLIQTLLDDRADMVVGTRKDVKQDAGRAGHALGNALFNKLYGFLFGTNFTDIFSGYRVFNRRFAKSFPAQSPGFEIETEMSVHASIMRLNVVEVECDYGIRGEDSESKLSTFGDGFKILKMMGMLMKETRPFIFFSYIAAAMTGIAFFFMTPVIIEYLQTGLVDRMPTWVMSMTLLLGAMMMFTAGVILDSLARSRTEQKQIHFQSIGSARGESFHSDVEPVLERRDTDGAWTGSVHQRKAPK